jgi:hypothetical protein
MAQNLGSSVVDAVKASQEPLLARIAALEAEIVELRRKLAEVQIKGIEYKGIYQRACSYEIGSVVTSDGGMWVANEDIAPNFGPGQSNSWQLCVRNGRDLRDKERRPHDG